MYKYIFLFLLPGLFSCSPAYKKFQSNAFDSVTVMANGGVTGSGKGYVIQQNGEVYVQFHYPNRPYDQKFYRQANTDSVLHLFYRLEQSNMMQSFHNEPGNMSYSIQMQQGDKIHIVVWSDGQDSTQSYIDMYRMLRSFAEGK